MKLKRTDACCREVNLYKLRLRGTALLMASAIVLAGLGGTVPYPHTALADTLDELKQQIDASQNQIGASNSEYEDATKRVSELEGQIEQNQQKLDELNQQLPEARDQASQGLIAQYKMQQSAPDLIGVLLDSQSLGDFIESIQYLEVISDRNAEQVGNLVQLTQEAQATQDDLGKQKAEAEQQKAAAKEALDDATRARQDLQKKMEEEQQREAEEAQRALEEAAAAATQGQTFTTESGNTATVEVPTQTQQETSQDTEQSQGQQEQQDDSSASSSAQTTPQQSQPTSQQSQPSKTSSSASSASSASNVNWSSDKSAFVAQWTSRIDSYLAGSPLAGHGKTFAEAAWDYGVDPRLSPAISNVESGRGAVCFRPHNAWGWGRSSWPDWDTAIRAHVSGIARGYGGYLTPSMAKKYCPPTWSNWYASVSAQMQRI